MDIEVDTNELKIIELDINKSANSFVEEIDLWKEQIERLKNIWQGEEANIFYSKIEEYILKLNMVSETEKIIGKAVRNSYEMYEEKDEYFKNALKNNNMQYDDEAFLKKANVS